MTGQRETTRYASAQLVHHAGTWYAEAGWQEAGRRYSEHVGQVAEHDAGWTAHTNTGLYVGLWPTKQAAAEVLVKQAGYELLL